MSAPSVLLIIGSGHSGSTIIDMSLGRRAGVISLGEYDRIGDYLASDPSCCCLQRFSTCEFWRPLMAAAPVEAKENGDSLALARSFETVYPDTKWLVDGSKKVQRARKMSERAPDRTKVLHLTRDGRGVMGSHAKQGFRNLQDFCVDWRNTNLEAASLVAALGPNRARHLSYEVFCKAPEAVVSNILSWLTPELGEAPERKNRQTHNLAGNRKRFTFHKRVSEDLSWQKRLSDKELAEFERLAGDLNRKLLSSRSFLCS